MEWLANNGRLEESPTLELVWPFRGCLSRSKYAMTYKFWSDQVLLVRVPSVNLPVLTQCVRWGTTFLQLLFHVICAAHSFFFFFLPLHVTVY